MYNRFDFSHTDRHGIRSISVLGDSIGAGVNTGDVRRNSFIGILRSELNSRTGAHNHGFCSVRGKYWGSIVSYDLHGFPEYDRELWQTEVRCQQNLGWDGFTALAKGASLTFAPDEQYRFFAVHYRSGEGFGEFSIDGTDEVVNCANGSRLNERTRLFDLASAGGRVCIRVVSDGLPVTISGISYLDDPDAIILNNYSAGGLRFGGEGDFTGQNGVCREVMDDAADCGLLVFELGGNDAHFEPNAAIDRPIFASKIDYLASLVKKNGARLVVADTIWFVPGWQRMNEEIEYHYKGELKRLAEMTGGIYLDMQELCGQPLLSTIADSAHPDARGHALMATELVKAVFGDKI